MKKVLCIFFLICIFQLNAREDQTGENNEYGGKTKIVIFNSEEQKETRLKKQIVEFDKYNKVKRAQNYFSDAYSLEKRKIKQVDYYDNNKIFKHEIFFTDDYAFQMNIDKVEEYVDKDDNLQKINYYKNNKIVFSETKKDYNKYDEREFLSLNFCDDYLKNAYIYIRKNENDFLFLDTLYLCGKSLVYIIGEVKEPDKDDIFFINEVWNKSVPSLKYNGVFKKLSVEENGNRFWIIATEKDIKKLKKNSKALIFFYYGGFNQTPIFMTTDIIYKFREF